MLLAIGVGHWHRLRSALLPGLLAALSACATLPAEEATAFRTLATANDEAFHGLTAAESAAASQIAIRRLADDRGRIVTSNCDAHSAEDCTLTYTLDGAEVPLTIPAPNTRALIGAIARYGEQMGNLAEAKDVDELRSKAEAAGGAVRGLFAVVPGVAAIADPIVNLAVLAYRGSLVEKRRRLLLVNAEAAKPAIDKASTTMTAIAGLSRENIADSAAQGVRAAQLDLAASRLEREALEKRAAKLRALAGRGSRWAEDSLDRVEARQRELRGERAAQADGLIRAAATLNVAKGLETDFSELAKAHDALVGKLRDPDTSMEEALGNLNAFLSVLDQFSAIGKSAG